MRLKNNSKQALPVGSVTIQPGAEANVDQGAADSVVVKAWRKAKLLIEVKPEPRAPRKSPAEAQATTEG